MFFLLFSLSELFAFILPQENFSLPPSFSFKPADYPLFNQLRFFLAADNLPEFFQTPLTNYEVLDKVSKEIINYFMGKGTRDEPGLRDENSGLFVDFGSAKDPTVDLSIAATGYGLTALVIAAEYGLIDKGTGEAWVVKALTTIKEMQDVALNYEKDLIDYLLTEGVKKLPYPDPATYSILYRLGKKGWERFLALEELRDRFEVDFLKEKKGYKLAYLQEEIDYKREKGLSRELDPNERAEVNLRFLRKYSEIFKLGRFGLLYRYLNRVKPEPPDGKIPLPSRSIKEGLNDLSTVDTGILLMGVLTAGRYFGGKAWELAQGIYENVNWQMMINNPGNTGIGAGEHPEVISHGWTPEGVPGHPHASQKGFLEGRWDIYTDETLLLVLLAMGKPKSPSASYNSYKALLDLEPKELGKELYDKFEKNRAEVGGMPPAILSVQGGLWTYHMVNVWLDTQNRFDAQNKVNWYQNAVKATLANRNIVLKMKDNEGKTLAERYKTFDEHLWPITTMLTPLADIPGKSQGGYRMDIGVVKPTISPEKLREIPPLVAPNGYGGSIIHSLFSYLGMRYLASTEREIWTKGGFVDAFSYDMGTGGRPGEWFAGTQVAFSQGQFLQLFNLLGEMDKDKKSLWEITQNIPYFEKAFEKAGLKQLSEAPLLPEEISGEMRQEVRQRIEDLDKIIQGGNNQSILGMFIGIINHYLTKEGAREGEFKSLIELLKKRIAEKPDNPLLNYLFAETR
ncbi:MAG: glucoamylase family protein, partial [Candidatus Omnitrophota bacterium]